MICHVVLIRLKPEVTPEDTDAFIARATETLEPIPGVRNLRVGRGLGVRAERSYPVALVMEFDDDAALVDCNSYSLRESRGHFVGWQGVMTTIYLDKTRIRNAASAQKGPRFWQRITVTVR